MKDKIIFLDVDGVLNRAWLTNTRFEEACLEQFKLLVKNTNAKIAISSSWGEDPKGLAVLKEKLSEYGLEIFVNLYQYPDGTFHYAKHDFRPREILIQEWLDTHEHGNWVVLDDWDYSKEFPNNMVQTWGHHKAGLDDETRLQAEKILNAES